MQDAYDGSAVARMVDDLATGIAREFSNRSPLNVVGIRTRGETLADRLAAALVGKGFADIGRGVLDITLYRDDLSEIGPRPIVRPTHLKCTVDGVPMILVDDVLFTGRTVRAALDALADFGRPKVVRLAVLADRGGRELPIQGDYVAVKLGDLPMDQKVRVKFKENDGVDGISIEPRHTP
jgi:pyrimidine operon attenuation protein/uracil phosphoribosyltransferase